MGVRGGCSCGGTLLLITSLTSVGLWIPRSHRSARGNKRPARWKRVHSACKKGLESSSTRRAKARKRRVQFRRAAWIHHCRTASTIVGVNAAKPILLVALFLCAGNAFAQTDDKEPVAVVELGAAASRSLTEGQSSFGPTVAVEVTPIENWLELELGSRLCFAGTRPNGAPTLSSKNRGRCPIKSSLCWE